MKVQCNFSNKKVFKVEIGNTIQTVFSSVCSKQTCSSVPIATSANTHNGNDEGVLMDIYLRIFGKSDGKGIAQPTGDR